MSTSLHLLAFLNFQSYNVVVFSLRRDKLAMNRPHRQGRHLALLGGAVAPPKVRLAPPKDRFAPPPHLSADFPFFLIRKLCKSVLHVKKIYV